jgi:hypothetical protein
MSNNIGGLVGYEESYIVLCSASVRETGSFVVWHTGIARSDHQIYCLQTIAVLKSMIPMLVTREEKRHESATMAS